MAAQQKSRLLSGWILCFSMGWISHLQAGGAASWENLHTPDYVRSRTEAVDTHYNQHKAALGVAGQSPEMGVLMTMFGVEESEARQCADGQCQKDLQKLTINTFPYWTEEGIVQLLFFTTSNDWNEELLRHKTTVALDAEIPALADKQNWDTLIKINPAINRTVPGFAHSHVFIRHRTNDSSQVYQLIKELPFSVNGVPPADWQGMKYLQAESKPKG